MAYILSVRKDCHGRDYREKPETFEIVQISGMRNLAADPEAKGAVENVVKEISAFARMTQIRRTVRGR
jgi:hypothetical protein